MSDVSVNEKTYAGDVTPTQAWDLVARQEALLIDVRTTAERNWVGFVPQSLALPWKEWPSMQANPEFDLHLQTMLKELALKHPNLRKILFLCRSGVRSVVAAERATQLFLDEVDSSKATSFEFYNILDGFEGALSAQGQRGAISGWRYLGLPWLQN